VEEGKKKRLPSTGARTLNLSRRTVWVFMTSSGTAHDSGRRVSDISPGPRAEEEREEESAMVQDVFWGGSPGGFIPLWKSILVFFISDDVSVVNSALEFETLGSSWTAAVNHREMSGSPSRG